MAPTPVGKPQRGFIPQPRVARNEQGEGLRSSISVNAAGALNLAMWPTLASDLDRW